VRFNRYQVKHCRLAVCVLSRKLVIRYINT
jgi:hypothetical protein